MKFNISNGYLKSVILKNNEKEVIIPEGVRIISEHAFLGCAHLEKVTIPSSVISIYKDAFSHCEGLKEIYIPDSVTFIGESAFGECKKLKKVRLPNNLEVIEDSMFYGCESLEEVIFPLNLLKIEDSAFRDCTALEKVDIPDSVNFINYGAFEDCESLKEVHLPSQIEEISPYAFSGTDIEKIIIPDSVVAVFSGAFQWCRGKEIYLGDKLTEFYSHIFTGCDIEKIRIGNFYQLKEYDVKEYMLESGINYFYINDDNGEIVAFREEQKDLEGYRKINYDDWYKKMGSDDYMGEAIILSLVCEANKKYIEETQSKIFFQTLVNFINRENYKEVKQAFDTSKTFFRFLNNCYFRKKEGRSINAYSEIYSDIFKLAYTLGAFDENQIARQKACEYLNNIFEKKKLSFHSIHGVFESMNFEKYDKDWAEFFMKNFDELMKVERNRNGFIAYAHNSFSDIKEFGRRNRGEQNYRKVTINMCLEYMEKANFKGVSERDEDISNTIALYTREQVSFDNAVEIRNEYLKLKGEGNIDDHILNEHLFDEIDKTSKEIISDTKETLANLNGLANKNFSYEFMSKYDPNNFILGKYCSCCAHIEGAGYGIMRASIVNPNCQNVVIKDKNGKIIAKSTLYINKTQGYGILNNFEVNNNITSDKVLNLIYTKFKKSVTDFVKKYNEVNENNPINQINVGMNLNDLEKQIRDNDTYSHQILNGIHFSAYGKDGKRYDGDWKNEKYIFFKNNKK